MKDNLGKQHQNQEVQKDRNCIFCLPNQQSLVFMIKQALYKKYSKTQKFYYQKPIMQILDEQIQNQSCHYYDSNYLQYKQLCFFIDDVQNLKRFYLNQQYQHKIILFSQYFMENLNFPTIHVQKIEKIMANYKNARRKYEYEKQLGQISSQTSFSSSQQQNSFREKKSKYSSILSKQKLKNIQQPVKTKISQISDSYLLQEIITQINQSKFMVNNKSLQIKGRFYFNQQYFDKFIEREEIRKKQKVKNTKKIIKKKPQIKNNQIKKISQKKNSLNQVKLSKNKLSNKFKFFYENKQIRNKQFYAIQYPTEDILEQSRSKDINQQEIKNQYYNFLKKKPQLFESQTVKLKKRQSPYGTIIKPTYQGKSASKQKKIISSPKITDNTNSNTKLQKKTYFSQVKKQQKLNSDNKSSNQPIFKIRSFSAHQITSNKKSSIKINPELKPRIVQQIINNKLTLFGKQKIKL